MWELNLKRIDLSLKDNELANIDISKFVLKDGINILTGENGIGKSVFMKVLAGDVHFINNPDNFFIELTNCSNPNQIKRYCSTEEAINCNVRALYQDDEMIKDLQIWEHIAIYSNIKNGKKEEFSREKTQKILSKFVLQDNDDQQIFKDIWNKRPQELSMGQKSIAKIIITLYDCFDDNGELNKKKVESNIDILLLDEILASVSKDRSSKIIHFLRNLYELKKEISILLITHNPLEVIRWQPTSLINLIAITDGETRKRETVILKRNAKMFCPGVYNPINPIPVYNSFSNFLDDFNELFKDKKIIVIIDNLLKDYANKFSNVHKIISFNDCSENIKINDNCLNVITKIAEVIESYAESIIFIVGGGALLNVAAFAISILYRGRCKAFYFPSTVTSACDVALGSKTGFNLNKKHHIGSYFNPEAIIIDDVLIDRFLAKEIGDVRINFAELFKHAILQDKILLEDIKIIITGETINLSDTIKAIQETMMLKSKIMTFDPYEENLGRLLLFGHLHARVLEEYVNFNLPHDCAVWLGIYIDLTIGMTDGDAKKNILSYIERVIFSLIKKKIKGITFPLINLATIRALYQNDPKGECYMDNKTWYCNIIKLNKVGAYGDDFDTLTENNLLKVDLNTIVDKICNLYNEVIYHN